MTQIFRAVLFIVGALTLLLTQAPANAQTPKPVASFVPPAVDPFLATDSRGGVVLWNGSKLVKPGAIGKFLGRSGHIALFKKGKTVKILNTQTAKVSAPPGLKNVGTCGYQGEPGFVLVGEMLYFISGHHLKQLDLAKGRVKTLRKRVLSKGRPDCNSISYDADKKILAVDVGLYEDCGMEWPEFNNSRKITVRISAPAPVVSKAKPAPVCTWSGRDKKRPFLDLVQHRKKLHLAIRKGKKTSRLQVVDSLEKYQDCMRQTEGDDSYCMEMKPRIECSQMKRAPFSLCELLFWEGGADYRGKTLWFDEAKLKVDIEKNISTGSAESMLAPSGCWVFIDDALFGSGSTPTNLRGLKLLTWL